MRQIWKTKETNSLFILVALDTCAQFEACMTRAYLLQHAIHQSILWSLEQTLNTCGRALKLTEVVDRCV